ncbi:MAG: hypothetical protein MK078_03225 [Crocinitomicaceae bacterium]|nr:hypothetical protein [Crocinitomicaceae bacterium]
MYIYGSEILLPQNFNDEVVSELKHTSFSSGKILLDKDHSNYPVRSDEKIMRQDTIASILCTSDLINNSPIKIDNYDTGLFVGSGVFIENVEKHLGHLTRVYDKIKDETDNSEKNHKLYRISPPLLALQTLTNSTMSFIAQYVGLKGNNATYGNTSYSGFQVIKQALIDANLKKKYSVAVSSNGAGEYSFLVNSVHRKNYAGWKEGACASSLLIGPEKDAAIAKIHQIKAGSNTSFFEGGIRRNWAELLEEKIDVAICSGAFTEEESNDDLAYCSGFVTEAHSLFSEFGNLGASNIHASINKGIELLNSGDEKVAILDRDIYNRETLVVLTK